MLIRVVTANRLCVTDTVPLLNVVVFFLLSSSSYANHPICFCFILFYFFCIFFFPELSTAFPQNKQHFAFIIIIIMIIVIITVILARSDVKKLTE